MRSPPVIKGRGIGQNPPFVKTEGAIKCLVRSRVAAQSRGPFAANNGLGEIKKQFSVFTEVARIFTSTPRGVIGSDLFRGNTWSITENFPTIVLESSVGLTGWIFVTRLINQRGNEKYNEAK